MKKNKKDNKVKLNATDVALICGMLHLDCGKMLKYEKKILKNNPALRETIDLIGKDTKTYLAVMLGYHIAKIEKVNKKKKKSIAKSRKSNKKCQAKDEFYWQTETNRNFAGNTDSLFDSELPPLGILPSDINNKAEAAAKNTTANNEKSQDKLSDDKPVGEDAGSEIIYRADPENLIGKATVSDVLVIGSRTVVADCMVDDGKLKVHTKAQVIRCGRVVYEGTIVKLNNHDDDVNGVCSGRKVAVAIGDFSDYEINDVIECFEDEPDADNTNTDMAVPQTDNESLSSQCTVPKFINGGDYKILVTNVDIDNGTLTYLDLAEWCMVAPVCVSSVLSADRSIDEAAHCELAEKFGIDPEYVNSGVDHIRIELPTEEQIETLKTFDISRFDTVLSGRLTNKPILIDDGTDEGKYKSRTAMMPNGKIAKRNSNWNALVIPSVTIEF
mgnify:CR=1 FL=1